MSLAERGDRARRSRAGVVGVVTAAALLLPGTAGRTAPVGPPVPGAETLEAFGQLLVGTWEAPGSRNVHEWGVGRRVIRSRGYFETDGEWRLVSEGIWFWSADEGVVRGTHLVVDMPMDRMEYRTTVEGNRVVHRLETHGEDVERYVETWTFSDHGYRWVLERPGPQGPERVMGGEYRRVPGGEG